MKTPLSLLRALPLCGVLFLMAAQDDHTLEPDPCAVCPQDAGCLIVQDVGVICEGGTSAACVDDQDCPGGLCVGDDPSTNVCVYAASCVADADCGSGHVCVEHLQCFDVDPNDPLAPPCLAWSECVAAEEDPPVVHCFSDDECAEGEVCQPPADDTCLGGNGETYPCPPICVDVTKP